MELTRVGEEGATGPVLRSAWWAWWAVAVSWLIALVRLTAMFLSDLSTGAAGAEPTGAFGTVYDIGFIAVSSSTAVAVLFVVLLAWRTRRGGRLAVAVALIVIGGVLFVYFREFAAWMVAAKAFFAFTPGMVRMDAIYTVLTVLTLLFASPTYFGQLLVAVALVLTAVFLYVAARRWRNVERIIEDAEMGT